MRPLQTRLYETGGKSKVSCSAVSIGHLLTRTFGKTGIIGITGTINADTPNFQASILASFPRESRRESPSSHEMAKANSHGRKPVESCRLALSCRGYPLFGRAPVPILFGTTIAEILDACRRVSQVRWPRAKTMHIQAILAACRRELQVTRGHSPAAKLLELRFCAAGYPDSLADKRRGSAEILASPTWPSSLNDSPASGEDARLVISHARCRTVLGQAPSRVA